MMGKLMEAAILADSKSASRRLRIELKINPIGVLVEGQYLSADSETIHTSKAQMNWMALDAAPGNPMLVAINAIDKELRALWVREGK